MKKGVGRGRRRSRRRDVSFSKWGRRGKERKGEEMRGKERKGEE